MHKRPLCPPARSDCLVDDPSDGNDPFSNNDQSKKAHSHIQVRALKANIWKQTGHTHHRPKFDAEYSKPNSPDATPKFIGWIKREIHLRNALAKIMLNDESKTHRSIDQSRDTEEDSSDRDPFGGSSHGGLNEEHGECILNSQEEPAAGQDQAQGLKSPDILITDPSCKSSAGRCKANHRSKLDGFTDPFHDRVTGKAYIEQGDLQPGEPDQTKEANVCA